MQQEVAVAPPGAPMERQRAKPSGTGAELGSMDQMVDLLDHNEEGGRSAVASSSNRMALPGSKVTIAHEAGPERNQRLRGEANEVHEEFLNLKMEDVDGQKEMREPARRGPWKSASSSQLKVGGAWSLAKELVGETVEDRELLMQLA